MVVSLEGVGGAEPAPLDGALDLVGGGVVVLRIHVVQRSPHHRRFRGRHLQCVFKREKLILLSN